MSAPAAAAACAVLDRERATLAERAPPRAWLVRLAIPSRLCQAQLSVRCVCANNAYDSRLAFNGDGANGSTIPRFEDLEDYGLNTTDTQFNALDLTSTER